MALPPEPPSGQPSYSSSEQHVQTNQDGTIVGQARDVYKDCTFVGHPSATKQGEPTAPPPQLPDSVRIFLSYKRGVTPDELVALEIYDALKSQHQVFMDQTMPVGTPWSEQIKQEIFHADVVIVLLSAQSVQSEMVQQEIELAKQSAEQRGGLPLIFPVRLAYSDPYRYPLDQYLNPLQWATWDHFTDTPRLISELHNALTGKPLPIDTEAAKTRLLRYPDLKTLAPPDAMAQPPVDQNPQAIPLDPPEGTIEADSAFYIRREEDQAALLAVQRQGCTISILGPRQMGKSSLLIQAMTVARQRQKKVVFLDFQRMETNALVEADLFYHRFCELLTMRLRVVSQVDRWWQQYQALGNPDRCSSYVQDYLLAELGISIFLAMDEVDKLIASPFRDEFFGMLRSWHNERAFEPIWKQLDLALVTCTEPYQLIQDLNQSPFNVGTAISLQDFQPQEVAILNHLHGNVLTAADLNTLMDWVGGHPYLVRKALYLVASGEMGIAAIFKTAKTDRGPFSGHLRYHFFRMEDKPHLVRGMLQVIRSQTCGDEQVLRRLEAAGLVQRSEVGRQVTPRCRLYAEYFREHLRE